MAKTIRFSLDTGHVKLRSFAGRSIFWNGPSNADSAGAANKRYVTATEGVSGGVIPIDIYQNGGALDVHMARLLFEIDISSLPLNAVIQSAVLHLNTISINPGLGFAAASFPFAIYRVFQPTVLANSNMEEYASSLDWAQYGMQDVVDYRNIAEATFTVVVATDLAKDFTMDVTQLARYSATLDVRRITAMISRTDASRRAVRDIGIGVADTSIKISTSQNGLFWVEITYVDALTHHPSDLAGTINTLIEVDTTANNLHQFDPVRVGTFGGAVKFWVKNQLSSAATNLKVLSRRSYGSKFFEFESIGTGNGLLSDISTVDKSADQVNYTRTERWRVIFETGDYALGQFHVYRDNGTFDDPAVADAWVAATPATGTLGVPYLSSNRGVGFTLTDGGTIFVDGAERRFRTFEDDAHPAAPADSDDYLEIAPDVANTPGTWQPLEWKPVPVTSLVSASTTVPVPDVTLFGIGTVVKFTRRTDGFDLGTRTVASLGVSSIVVDTPITLAQGDYVEAVPVGTPTIAAGGTSPYWLRTKAPLSAVRESKFPRWVAIAD